MVLGIGYLVGDHWRFEVVFVYAPFLVHINEGCFCGDRDWLF